MKVEQAYLFDNEKLMGMDKFHENWKEILPISFFRDVDGVLQRVKADAKNHTIYPEPADILRVFSMNPYDIKVVILGQDPYHTGNAMGLAFGCKWTKSASLIKIEQAIHDDLRIGRNNRLKDLSEWHDQGVFLLNTILTVREGQPLSHENIGWYRITRQVIQVINSLQPVAWCLWGSKARYYEQYVTNPESLILDWEHPAAAAYGKYSWGCNHFSKINSWLASRNQKMIKW